VPVRLRDERRANPFMAVRSTAVRAAVLALCAADEVSRQHTERQRERGRGR
jgi:hypothetical protein